MDMGKQNLPVLPVAITGVSKQLLDNFSDLELDTVVGQLADRLVESYQFMGRTTPTDAHHRAWLMAVRSEQLRRREDTRVSAVSRSLILHPVLRQYGDIA